MSPDTGNDTFEGSAALRGHLSKDFDPKFIGKIPASSGRPALDFVGHANVTARLNAAAPGWTYSIDELFTHSGACWIRGTMTVGGISRPEYGDGKDPKEAIGNFIRRGAMRFGVALSLWSREELEESAGTTGTAPAAPPQQVVRVDSPSRASEPAPAATGPTSGTGSIPPRSGGVGSVTSSPEDRSVEDTVAEGALGGTTSGAVASGDGRLGEGSDLATAPDYRAAVKKRGYTAGQILTKLKALGVTVSKFDDASGDDIAWAMDELDRAKKGRVSA